MDKGYLPVLDMVFDLINDLQVNCNPRLLGKHELMVAMHTF